MHVISSKVWISIQSFKEGTVYRTDGLYMYVYVHLHPISTSHGGGVNNLRELG